MENKVAQLLDRIKSTKGLKNDAALASALGVAPPVVSKLRTVKLPLGPAMIVKIHLLCDIPVRELVAIADSVAEVRELVAA